MNRRIVDVARIGQFVLELIDSLLQSAEVGDHESAFAPEVLTSSEIERFTLRAALLPRLYPAASYLFACIFSYSR